MAPSLFRRRFATAAGLYLSVGLGIVGTIAAARLLGLEDFGRFATVMALVGLAQTLLDLTVEESLTKFGFRYVASENWGKLRRLFRRALELKLIGGGLATLVLLALAPLADTVFGTDGLTGPMVAAAALPLLASPENVSASALLLRGRYDLRGWLLSVTMAIRLAAILIGASFGVTEALAAIAVGQVAATAVAGTAGALALRRFPRAQPVPLGADRREIVSFVAQSSVATGVLSLRAALTPVLLGVVAGTTHVGYYRIALAPHSGFSAVSAPVRLVLLTEQTRDWEHGRRDSVLRGVRRYSLAAAAVAAVAVPVFLVAMPWLVRVVFGREYLPAVDAARIVLVSAAILLVLGWTKSLPVTIGRPRLRIVTHGIETAVLLPLVVALGARWEVTGAAAAILISTVVFAVAWVVVLVRLRSELRTTSPVGAPKAAGP